MADGNKNKKYDRQRKSKQNQMYIAGGVREVNKARKLIAHIKRCGSDPTALKALAAISPNSIRDAFRKHGIKGDWTHWAGNKAA